MLTLHACMTRSARDLVKSNLADTPTDSTTPRNNQPADNEQVGLYDYPPNDPRSREHVTGRRQSRSTERNVHYRTQRTSEERKRRKSNGTRARNKSLRRTQAQDPATQDRQVDGDPARGGPATLGHEATPASDERGRSRSVRAISLSPSLGSPDCEREQPSQVPADSQYTYEYKTLTHEGLIDYAKELGLDVRGCDTHTIINLIKLAETQQASQVAPTRRPASIIVLPSTPIPGEGRWSQGLVGGSRATGSSTKRASSNQNQSSGSSKRQRTETEATATEVTVTEEDTATEEDEATEEGMAMEEDSATEDSATEPGTSKPGKIPPVPHIIFPISGPVRSRLRDIADKRNHNALIRHFKNAATKATRVSPPDSNCTDNAQYEVPEAAPDSTLRGISNPHTYIGFRSHLSSGSAAAPNNAGDANAANPPLSSDPPTTSTAQLVQKERVRAAVARMHEELEVLAPRRSRLFAPASQPPSSRSQHRPPPGGRGNAVGQLVGRSRRLDPISTAHMDMLDFNQAVAQGEATSFVESATRQSKRAAGCAPPPSRPADELLPDDEESLAHAEARAKSKWPRRPRRIRKSKPVARDVSGIERQVLVMAKVHLFAYALYEGIYQTRATFMRWAAAEYEATWQMELPDRPYQPPDQNILEIMVNNIATLRGKAKERLREFTARVAGFKQTSRNPAVIQKNIALFNMLYPNSFHCKTSNPRAGDYEHEEIAHCIALILFYSQTAVGVLYPDYFQDMSLTVVAFCLAIWQFCIEEWANGVRQNGDLGMGAMREKYEAQLAGLKELRDIAPRRMQRLQDRWRDYAAEYSGAVLVPEGTDSEPARTSRMRPDTPEPDNAISVEEMEARLLEHARQESIRENLGRMAAQELAEGMGIDEDEDSHASAPPSRSPSPPVEFNEYGVLTARSKGKRRDN
ncbi:unnamed protein product [Rhizoctonia solani]|nr:unnamed protein product [Rhizoctonia solani]